MKQTWVCSRCGEHLEADFDACWNCGTAQDGTLSADFRPEPIVNAFIIYQVSARIEASSEPTKDGGP